MRIHKNENIYPFDVDDTLVFAPDESSIDDKDVILVLDPLTGLRIPRKVNTNMVRLMREEKHRGGHIIVWSRGGWEWAQNVVSALGLETIVDDIFSKPKSY